MDDWQPDDPQLSQFDFNRCKARDFWEVFGMDAATSRMLHEYRLEVLFVFKLDQLLKLKGISDEMLQRWSAPQTDSGFDAKLQAGLGLRTDVAEPIPALLDAVCQATGASAALISRRDGNVLLKSSTGGPESTLAPDEVTELFQPVWDNMLQMNLPGSEILVLELDSNDLVYATAGALSIAATQPRGRNDSASLGLWKSLNAELKRRHPPQMIINTTATAGESDIAFECPSCGLGIVVDHATTGAAFPCPRCREKLTVPAAEAGDGSAEAA